MMNMTNLENTLHALNINELNTVWKALNDISQDFTDQGMDNISEKLDDVLDIISEHISYREAEMEALRAMEEEEANKYC